MKVLGLAGSLRSAVRPEDASALLARLEDVPSRDALAAWLTDAARRGDGSRGLSNSDAALVAALWAAQDLGADVGWRSLSWHFLPDRTVADADDLRADLLSADAVLLSGPVYFGDRSSLVQELVGMLRADSYLREAMTNTLYGGVAVGAKRNGGQETALIYQVLDMVSLGMLAVGNDSETTSQYGGTVHAGTFGTAPQDEQGLATALGTGRRLARLLLGHEVGGRLDDKVRVAFVVLQDARREGVAAASELAEMFADEVDAEVMDITRMDIQRCRACDMCPASVGADEDYRCLLRGQDDFTELHPRLLDQDIIVPVTVSVEDYGLVRSAYQVFMERMRYLRRGDYALSDTLFAPLTLVEAGGDENLHARVITSLIRQHTVVSRPLRAELVDGRVSDMERLGVAFGHLVHQGRLVAAARLAAARYLDGVVSYNPVGYVLRDAPEHEARVMAARREAMDSRRVRLRSLARRRLAGGYPL